MGVPCICTDMDERMWAGTSQPMNGIHGGRRRLQTVDAAWPQDGQARYEMPSTTCMAIPTLQFTGKRRWQWMGWMEGWIHGWHGLNQSYPILNKQVLDRDCFQKRSGMSRIPFRESHVYQPLLADLSSWSWISDERSRLMAIMALARSLARAQKRACVR